MSILRMVKCFVVASLEIASRVVKGVDLKIFLKCKSVLYSEMFNLQTTKNIPTMSSYFDFAGSALFRLGQISCYPLVKSIQQIL